MEKKKKEKIWGRGLFNFITAFLECAFIVAIICNTVAISTSLVSLFIDIKNDNLDNYYETFVPNIEHEDRLVYDFKDVWSSDDVARIENGEVKPEEIVAGAWFSMVSIEIALYSIIVVLKNSRRFLKKCQENAFKEENIAILHKMKRYLILSFIVPFIISIISIIFSSISFNYYLSIFTVLALYALFDFVEYLIRKGIELKPVKKEKEA